MTQVRPYFIHALSPLHCGIGHSTSGIDLPIARERASAMPIVPGSSIKGVLRGLSSADGPMQRAVFGPETAEACDHAGALRCSDALLAFLPVRSVRGTFAWVTSPYLVRRMQRAFAEAGVKLPSPGGLTSENQASVCKTDVVCVDGKQLVLEDFALTANSSPELGSFAKLLADRFFGEEDDRAFFLGRVALVHDDVMASLAATSMEITARNAIDPETHTVRRGALWTEEALPVESLLVGVMAATPMPGSKRPATTAAEIFKHVDGLVGKAPIQLGGHASVGRGVCRLALLEVK